MSDHLSDEDFGLRADEGERANSGASYASVGAVRGAGAVKGIFNPANKGRMLFYAFAAVLVVGGVAYSYLTMDESEVRGGSAGTVAPAVHVGSNENRGETSELGIKAAEEYNSQGLLEEQKTDPSAHPIIVTQPDEYTDGGNPFEGQEEVAKAGKVSDLGKTTSKAASYQRPGDKASDSRKQKAAEQANIQATDSLLKDLIEQEGKNSPKLYSTTWEYNKVSSGSIGGDLAQPGVVTDSDLPGAEGEASAQASCPVRHERAGQMAMATADLALNSDVGGPVSLTIRNGRLRGTQLIGKFERKEEWLRMELTTLVAPDETITNVNAIGLDMETTLNAVEGDLDSHLLYRYGWWGFGTVLKAVGAANEAAIDQTSYVSNGVVVQDTAKDTTREIMLALGSLGTDLGSVMQDRLNRPITVSLKVGDEVGVYFLEDVCGKVGANDE